VKGVQGSEGTGSDGAGRRVRRWLACAVALLATACVGATIEENPSAALFYAKGLKTLEGRTILFFIDTVDYPAAIAQFQEVIDNYPFSEFAPLAELKIADINREIAKFDEAASFYQDFVELHPTHPKLPYALYQLGECYISQMLDPDRDQESTRKALSQLEFLTSKFPESEYSEQAKSLLGRARAQLALREARIGDFYYGKEAYHAAAPRYRAALEQSGDFPGHCEDRTRLGISLTKLGMRSEAESVMNELRARCTDQEDLIEELGAALEQLQASRG
jgi:outer membrane assembly lipoprotein YfiO